MAPDTLPISVVVPAYRRAELLERALRSVFGQQPGPSQVLVIDDASGDDTGARAAACGAEVITRMQNGGEGAARNTGLARAQESWVALLDSDDEWLPGHLSTLWERRGNHVMVGTLGIGVGQGPGSGRLYGNPSSAPAILRSPAEVVFPQNRFVASGVMLRRDVALTVGGFRTGMPRAADLDMWIRMLEVGSALTIPRVTVRYHLHAEQVTADAPSMWTAHRDVLDSYGDRPWMTRGLRLRHEGVVAWDHARSVAGAGGGLAAMTAVARWLAAEPHPARVRGVIELLLERRRGRRLASRLGRTHEGSAPGPEGPGAPG